MPAVGMRRWQLSIRVTVLDARHSRSNAQSKSECGVLTFFIEVTNQCAQSTRGSRDDDEGHIDHAPEELDIITENFLSSGRVGHSQPEVSPTLPSITGRWDGMNNALGNNIV